MTAEAGRGGSGALPRRFLFNVNFVFASTLVSNTLGFFVAILIARALGPDGLGVLAIYQGAVVIAIAVLNLGIASAAFYYVVRSEIGGRAAMEAGASITLFATAVTGAGVLLTPLLLGGHMPDEPMPYALAVVAVPAVIQLRLLDGLLRAQGRFGAVNALEMALPVSQIICLGGVEVLVGLTVPRAVLTWSLSFLPAVVIGYAILGPRCWPRAVAPLSRLAPMVRFGGQGWLTTLLQLMNSRLDVFLIGALVSTTGVGLYRVASSQTEGLFIIANSVAIVLLTNITAGDRENSLRLTPVVCRNTLLVTAVGAAGAAIIAPFWLTGVFGASYEGSLWPYLLLLPGIVAQSGVKILAAYVFSRGRPIINAWIALFTLILTIPTDVVLIALFGVEGAAAGTSLGYGVALALTALAYGRLSGGSILEALLPQRSDVGLYVDGLRTLRTLRSRLRRKREEQPEAPRALDAGYDTPADGP